MQAMLSLLMMITLIVTRMTMKITKLLMMIIRIVMRLLLKGQLVMRKVSNQAGKLTELKQNSADSNKNPVGEQKLLASLWIASFESCPK